MKTRSFPFVGRSRPLSSSRGSVLVTFAFALMVFMGTAGLAVDLACLYTARAEAQRAADAAALAAAHDFANSGYTTGLLTAQQVETIAGADAAAVGNTNLILGQSPGLNPETFSATCPTPAGADGCFDVSTVNDPRVTVIAQRTAAHGNPLPLFFMKMFGIDTADVSASATAEAYNPSTNGGPPINMQDLKPWLTPNCDPWHVVSAGDTRANPNCPVSGGYDSYFLYPTGSPQEGQVVFPGQTPNGVVGEQFVLKPGSPSAAPAPSQFYPIYLPQTNQSVCPAGAATNTNSNGSGSASLYEQNIECWTPETYTCGQQSLQVASGNMVGPTSTGVDLLIHEDGTTGMGQDTMDLSVVPFQILAGADNPYYTEGQKITSSDSIAVVPLYDGSNLCPGGSCQSGVDVQGFLQIFIASEGDPSGTVTSYVMNAGGCGNSQQTAISAWANPVVVRLIHN